MESHRRRLTRLKNNYTPKMILDIGAYNGEWAMMAKGVFPDSEIFMIEANEDKREILSKLNYPFEIALLGNINRSDVDYYVTNYKHSTGNSIYREQSVYFNDENCSIRKIPMITLDYLIKEKMPFTRDVDFIKMDVQGSELNILKGAENILKTVKYVLLETQVIDYNANSPKFIDIIKYMNDIDFVIYDLFEVHYSPSREMTEIDLLFQKKEENVPLLKDLPISTIDQLKQGLPF